MLFIVRCLNSHKLWFHVEYRFVGFGIDGIVVDGTIVCLYATGGEEIVNLSSCPYYGAIAMCCIVVDRTIGIESGIEGKSCSYTCAFNLPLVGDVGRNIVPCLQSLSDVWFWLYPTFIDGVS